MTARPAPNFSTGLEDLRRRTTARVMRGVFRAGSTEAALLPRSGIHRILVCRSVKTLGDSLTLTPLLAELANIYPGAEVDVVSRCPVADDLYGAFPNTRTVHSVPRHVASHWWATARTLRAMRSLHYDLVIDPDPQSQSGRLLALSAHATYSLGYVGPQKSGTLTHGVAIPDGLRHKAMMPVYLLRCATGEDPAARDYPQPGLMLSNAELKTGRQILARLSLMGRQIGTGGPRIGIFANATGDKLVAGDWWQQFITALLSDVPDCRIVEILPAFGKSMLGDRFPCFYSSDVRKLAALLANLDAYVSADCGVMHLAWAAGAPTVGLFDGTDPAEWGPFGPRASALPLAVAAPQATARQVAQQFAALGCQGMTVTAPATPG